MNNYIFPFDRIDRNTTIVLYGAGKVGQCFYKQLITLKWVSIYAWVDRAYENYQKIGWAVDSPERLREITNEVSIVIAIDNMQTAMEVKDQILSVYKNISQSQIVYVNNYWFPKGMEGGSEEEILNLEEEKRNDDKSDPETAYDRKSERNRRLLNGKIIKKICTIKISVRDLILAQYRNWDYSNYQHCDMAVRLLAAEEEEKKNNIGFALYKRMQEKTGFDWTDRYRKLIKSINQKGFIEDRHIELDRNLIIMDGSHRTTMAWLKGIEFLYADIYDCDRDRNFGIDYFWENGFTTNECRLITEKTTEILKACRYEFAGIIWPSAYHIADTLIHGISEYAPENIKVISYKDLTYDKDDFYHLFKAIYAPDVLDDSGMEIKFRQIEKCVGINTDKYTVRFFWVNVEEPMMNVNEKNHLPQSLAIKRLKKIIRSRYRELIEKYEYDVMVHISDNYVQSRMVTELLSLDRDVSSIVEVLNRYDYVSIKLFGRQHKMFPYYYYYYWGDMDILVHNEEMEQIADDVERYMRNRFNRGWQNIERRYMDNTVIIWMKVLDLEVFGVHLQTVEHFGMDSSCNSWMIEQKEQLESGIFFLPVKYDLYFRLIEYVRKPYKKHHIAYIEANRELIDEEMIKRLWGKNYRLFQKIKYFLAKDE